MEIPIFTVDAFTTSPFKGNPAAVCLLEHPLPEELYQSIATEMNLSETAYVRKLDSTGDFCTGDRFSLRWFTPVCEVALCGHATLASAAVLFYKKENTNPILTFETLSGELRVRQRGDSLVMDFPLRKPHFHDHSEFKDLIRAAVGDLPIQDVCYYKTIKKLLVCLTDTCDRSVFKTLKPVREELLKYEDGSKIDGLIVTLKGECTPEDKYDFYSRYFDPWDGVLEDPVTGSAHTMLAPYWAEKLRKRKMLACQCSQRGGELEVELRDDDRVDITGQIVFMLQGTFKL